MCWCFSSSCRAGEAQRLDFQIQNVPVDSLSVNNRRILGAGFVDVLKDYEGRMAWIGPTYVILRVLLGLSLISLVYTTTIDSKVVSLTLSIAAVVSHIGREYLSIDKRYLSTLSITTRLKLEGWDFVTLGGAYSMYESQDECIQEFMETVRRLRTQYLNEFMTAVRESGTAIKSGHAPRTSFSNIMGQPKTAGASAGGSGGGGGGGAEAESKGYPAIPPQLMHNFLHSMLESAAHDMARKVGDLGERGPLNGLVTPHTSTTGTFDMEKQNGVSLDDDDDDVDKPLGSTQLSFPRSSSSTGSTSALKLPPSELWLSEQTYHVSDSDSGSDKSSDSESHSGEEINEESKTSVEVVILGEGQHITIPASPVSSSPHSSRRRRPPPPPPSQPPANGMRRQRLPTHLGSPRNHAEPWRMYEK